MSGEANKTILLVEDEALIALNEAETLRRHGFSVTTVHSAEQAIAAVNENNIDLVLMDINLGPEAADAILRFLDVPILFLSSHTDPETLKKIEAISSYGYAAKMSGDPALITSVNTAFKLHQTHMQLKQEKGEKDLQAKLLGAVEQAVIVTDIDGTVTFWNPFAEKLYGWKKDEVLGRNIREFTVPEMSREEAETVMKRLAQGGSYAGEFLVRNKAEKAFYIHITNSPIFDDDGNLNGIIGVSYDISDQKTAEIEREQLISELDERIKELHCLYQFSELIETSGTLEEILTGLPSIIQRAYQYPGITAVRIRYDGKEYRSEHYAESPWFQQENINVSGKRGGAVHVFYLEEKPKQDEGPFLEEERSLLLLLAERLGKVIARYEAEDTVREQGKKIRASEELHRMTLQSIGDAVISTDNEGRIVTMNGVAETLTGYSLEEAYSKPIEEVFTIVHNITGERLINPVEKVLATGKMAALSNHTKLVSGKGREFQIADTAAPILDDNGITRGVVLVFRDETEQRRAYTRLEDLVSEKDTLLREVHHRVKNNINIIASLLSLQSDTVTSEDGKQALTEARNRVVSMQKLYAHLFQSDEYAKIDLGVYLNDIIQEIIGTYAGRSITIFSELEDITTGVKLAVPLGIVVNELVVNAVKHAFSDNDNGIIEITMTKTGASHGELSVRDNGPGLPETIDINKPKGFGLTLVRSLVDQVKGSLSVSAGPNEGTEFRITF
jgi:PAS domain S-box-containing protein